MIFNRIKINHFLYSILIMLALISCNSKADKKAEEEDHHEEEAADVTSLTQEQIKAVGVTFQEIESRSLTATIKANGALRVPNNFKANATSLYGGVVKTLNVEFGDHVKKGQVIATISNPQFIQLQEEYLTINSQIILAEAEMKRQQELMEGNAGAKRNLQNATAEWNTLKTRQYSLRQQIELMGINPKSITNSNLQSALIVRSPINGTISNVIAKIGSYVDVASPIAEIVDNNSIHLDLQIFEKDLPLIKEGQTLYFTITNNPSKTYSAKVFSIGSTFENASKTIAVHCDIIGDKVGLIDGMNITANINLSDVMMLAVPQQAIVEAEGKYYIFIKTAPPKDQHTHGDEEDHNHGKEEKHNHLKEEHDHSGEDHKHGEEEHVHVAGEKHLDEYENNKGDVYFKRYEVVKGVTSLGFTAITPISDLPAHAKVVVTGAFFVNAKLNDTGEDGHAH